MKTSKYMKAAQEYLTRVKGQSLSLEERKNLSIKLAEEMLCEARGIQTPREKAIQKQLARMMRDPVGRVFITSMTDQCFRSKDSWRVADQLVYLIEKYGVPQFLSPFKRFQMKCFKWLGRPFSRLLVPLVKRMVQRETANVILPGEPKALSRHIRARREEGVHINLNHLGEAILGEEEAQRRLQIYLNDLKNPEIECVSVKISTIYSQINLLSAEDSIKHLSKRLKALYRCAKENLFVRADGTQVPKFVNLDMEEYRDLHLTMELFKQVLGDAEFFNFSAGIVLQSYLPDAFCIQKELTAWAARRVASGGAPIKIRIVKGANLAMEQVESSLKGWPQAPYLTKAEVDANYKRMVDFGCEPEHARAVNLGIASHNLFDIAYGLILRAEKKVDKYVCFEMLEGMADHLRRVVQNLSGDMLLYCPAAIREEFQNAVAYLVRRLDENTAPENFLRHAFDIFPGNKDWQAQVALFAQACANVDKVSSLPARRQNRWHEPESLSLTNPFENEADTDWSLPQNQKWAEMILREWSSKVFGDIPLSIGMKEIDTGVEMTEGYDPSFPNKVLYRYALGGMNELELALVTAEKGFTKWSARPMTDRVKLLGEAAKRLRRQRGKLMGAMTTDTGKTLAEGDVEVSEAIDFIEYYCRQIQELHSMEDIEWRAKGPILVAPPWNFPCSIPIGGISAALVAGNSVIFKPAPEAVMVGWELVNIFWEAGVDKDVLQFFCCPDDPIGSRLICDPRLKGVLLTGATSTAKLFLQMRPGLDLMAETGGKNAMIITRMSDRDLAIKDLLQSAFGHAGQKCSACSLAILEKEVYEDKHFRQQLRDAAASLKVGSPWNPSTKVNPLIRMPHPELLRGLTTLDPGEEWLLMPVQDPQNSQLWSPGIKYGVKPNSFMHRTELFGPVLGVMCAKDLDEAIALANGTPYGLTSGLHSLDEREQKYWLRNIVAGNCYINRGITGAIVQRQPFGGCKESSFGPGAKAGGPNYVAQLMQATPKSLPLEREPVNDAVDKLSQHMHHEISDRGEMEIWNASIGSYAFFWNHYFSKAHDPSKVRGQANTLKYVPYRKQVLRIQAEDRRLDVMLVLAAALTCHAPLIVSYAPEQAPLSCRCDFLHKMNIVFVEEDEHQFISRISEGKIKRLRLLSPCNNALQRALGYAGTNVIVSPVQANGRLELLHFLREVSISFDYHRYGFLGLGKS